MRAELAHDRSRIWISEVHMPALNTPQFAVSRSHMNRKAQPVAPIYQPELAARAVVWASEHRRRTLLVGPSTVATVLGGLVAPRLLDLFLGRTNYSAQLRDEPEDPARPDYLDAPVPGDHGAHGPFDLRDSALLTLSTHRAPALTAVSGLLAAGAWRVARTRRGLGSSPIAR